MADYSLYILRCADGTLYTGIATDAARRLAEHNGLGRRSGKGRGARYTASRRPVELIFEMRCGSRSDALRAEARIKRLPRARKLALISIQAPPPDILIAPS
jgi:predicted GIY-YIG superfamily endonuclease